MSSKDISARIQVIEDKDQISDVVYRYCRSIDRNDLDLFKTVFWDDGGYSAGPMPAVSSEFSGPMIAALKFKYEATQHFIGNISIDLDGDIAFTESYLIAYHKSFATPAGNEAMLGKKWLEEGNIDKNISHDLIIGLRYVDRFEKRSGEWRIALRTLVFDWSQVRPSNSLGFGPFDPSNDLGIRGKEDVSYKRSMSKSTFSPMKLIGK